MADRIQYTVFKFNRGFATNLSPQVRAKGTMADLDHLTDAEDCLFETDESVRKLGGAANLNGTAITGGPAVVGGFDFWTAGTAGAFTQFYVVVTADGKVYWANDSGAMTDITGSASIGANVVPVFCQARDSLLIFTSNNDTALSWTGSGNVAALAGSPPAGRGAAFHANRVWIWSANDFPSRITYGSSTTIADYTSADTGNLDIDPDDGDRIVAAVPHKTRLIVLKGPNKGSIHIVSGTTPSTFARTVLVRGVALQSPNAVVEVGDDLWFATDTGIYSLAATERFGDFTEADVVGGALRNYFLNNVNRTRLNRWSSANYLHQNIALFAHTSSAAATEDRLLALYYGKSQGGTVRVDPQLWLRAARFVGTRINPTTKVREVVTGSSDGYIVRQNLTERNINTSTAYQLRVRTPQVLLAAMDAAGKASPDQPVYLTGAYMKSQSVGSYNVTLRVRRDENAQESYTFNQAVSGFVLDSSSLDTDTLADNNLQTVWADVVGEARAVELELVQGGLNQDAKIYEVGLAWTPGSQSKQAKLAAGT